MFDSLIVLDVGGYQIYYGNPVESLIYFKQIIDAVDKTEGTCPECGNINAEKIFNIIETKIVDEYRIRNPSYHIDELAIGIFSGIAIWPFVNI